MNWPEWWSWDLEFTPHLLKPMVDRRFNEADLRLMLEEAKGFRPDVVECRYVVETTHAGRSWEVIVAPDEVEQVLLVITAYPVG
jgi:hypothetical protein